MKRLISIFLSLIFLIWFAGSVVIMIRSAKTRGDMWLVPVVLGQFFFVFGILGLTAILRSDDKHGVWLPAIFIAAGAITAGGGVLYHYGLLWFW